MTAHSSGPVPNSQMRLFIESSTSILSHTLPSAFFSFCLVSLFPSHIPTDFRPVSLHFFQVVSFRTNLGGSDSTWGRGKNACTLSKKCSSVFFYLSCISHRKRCCLDRLWNSYVSCCQGWHRAVRWMSQYFSYSAQVKCCRCVIEN